MYSIDILYSTPQKFFSEKDYLWKKNSTKLHFSFFFIGPLYPHWEHCHSEKHFSKNFCLKVFLSQKQSFYHLSCVSPSVIFAKPFNILFSWKYFSMPKKITWKVIFGFQHQSSLPALINMLFQNFCLEKHFFSKEESFKTVTFIFNITSVYPNEESYQNNQLFFEENKIQWRKHFLQIITFVPYHRSTALLLITMLFKNFYWKNIFKENYFP